MAEMAKEFLGKEQVRRPQQRRIGGISAIAGALLSGRAGGATKAAPWRCSAPSRSSALKDHQSRAAAADAAPAAANVAALAGPTRKS